jgi:uncharacterized protein
MDDECPDPGLQDTGDLKIKVLPSIHRASPKQWDICSGAGQTSHNPFVRHAFFSSLEDSGSTDADAGWHPQHIVVEDSADNILACAPLFLKSHSYGEYVFDWGWADAYQRAGGRYYPKLQCAVPFTPVTGPRLMVRPSLDDALKHELRRGLLGGMIGLAERLKVSSLHVTFSTEEEYDVMTEAGFLPRLGEQYHWENKGYSSFDEFLSALSSRKRKNIRKEREQAKTYGVKIRTFSGDDIKAHHWDSFFQFYMNTSDRKWGQAYLTRSFFDLLSERMGDAVLLIVGEEDGRLVCGALNFIGGDTIFGRNWGTIANYPMLHFEVCYYRAIDFAIEHQLKWVEAGAQGPHKIQRGYMPKRMYSSHWIADDGFRSAVAEFLDRERTAISANIEVQAGLGPFKRTTV